MIGIVYNNYNKLKMKNELSSIKFQMVEDIELVHTTKDLSDYSTLIVDTSFDYTKKNDKNDKCRNQNIVIIVDDINKTIYESDNIIAIQYSSVNVKNKLIEKYTFLNNYESIVIGCIPRQKLEIEPLTTQGNTIFYHGEDKPEDMVDEMFLLDVETHYEILFYENKTEEVPSKKHKLSWNVTTNENLKGIIQYKIIKEIENGCLPILLKENMPRYFFAYPFIVTKEELKDKDLLVKKVKSISSYISKLSRDDFKMLANSIYNSIYINSKWKVEFYNLVEIIRLHSVKPRV